MPVTLPYQGSSNETQSRNEKSGLLRLAFARRRKFRNKPCEVDGIKFDSRAEAKRYNELKLFVHEGSLTDLELQPKFALVVNGEKVCTYIADFSYKIRGMLVVEDVKSKATKTPQYRIKVKLLRALTGIEVREVA